MSSVLTAASGRRAKWVVLALALLVVLAAGSQAGKFEDAQENEQSSFLPGDSESVAAIEELEGFESGQTVPAIVVYQRDEGLSAEDRSLVASDRRDFAQDPPPGVDAPAPAQFSEDGTAALLPVPIDPQDDSETIVDGTNEIRDRVGGAPDGLQVEVTGAAGFAADQIEVFESIDGALLLGTAALVFVLLIAIYRSPIFWFLPFLAVVLAEVTSRGLGYGLTELGVTVNGQSASILVVLVFGAGTDYALLLIARYREELRRHEDKHEAMALALRRAGPAIVASGLTVIAALLCLTLADLNGTAGLGPIAAMGVALAMITMLTLLPAIVLIAGRRAFWPFVPRFGGTGADETHGFWRQVGERVSRAPRRVWIGVVALLAVLCAGLAFMNSDLTTGNGFREDVDAVEGQELISAAFPAGANIPTTVVVPDPERVGAVRSAVEQSPAVAQIGQTERGAPGARFDVVLEPDPYSQEAFDLIPGLREVAKEAGGEATLVGGPTAEERDFRVAAAHDNRLIVPIVLVVVFLILAGLLRAVVAPLVLIGTVILSYAAALGVGAFFFEQVFGFAGIDPTLPLFAFIFLVALGVDYNIFLMARVREETFARGTREGAVRGLAVTGAVITSAGIVLAGTFSILAILPLLTLTEIGFVIAFGVLLDTFIVRSVLVPALVLDLDRRTWWPSRLARREPDRRDHSPAGPGDEPGAEQPRREALTS